MLSKSKLAPLQKEAVRPPIVQAAPAQRSHRPASVSPLRSTDNLHGSSYAAAEVSSPQTPAPLLPAASKHPSHVVETDEPPASAVIGFEKADYSIMEDDHEKSASRDRHPLKESSPAALQRKNSENNSSKSNDNDKDAVDPGSRGSGGGGGNKRPGHGSGDTGSLPSFLEVALQKQKNEYVLRPFFLTYFDTREFLNFTWKNYREDHILVNTRFLDWEEGGMDSLGKLMWLVKFASVFSPDRTRRFMLIRHLLAFVITYSFLSWEAASINALMNSSTIGEEYVGMWMFLIYLPYYFYQTKLFYRNFDSHQDVSTEDVLNGFVERDAEQGASGAKAAHFEISWSLLVRLIRPVWLTELGKFAFNMCVLLATTVTWLSTALRLWYMYMAGIFTVDNVVFTLCIRLTCFWYLSIVCVLQLALYITPFFIVAYRARFLMREFALRDNYYHLQYGFDDVTFEFHSIATFLHTLSSNLSFANSSAIVIMSVLSIALFFNFAQSKFFNADPFLLIAVIFLLIIVMILLCGCAYATYHTQRLTQVLASERGQLGPRPFLLSDSARKHTHAAEPAARLQFLHTRSNSYSSEASLEEEGDVEAAAATSEDKTASSDAESSNIRRRTNKIIQGTVHEIGSKVKQGTTVLFSQFNKRLQGIKGAMGSSGSGGKAALADLSQINSQFWREYAQMDVEELTQRNAQLRRDFDSFATYVNLSHPGGKISGVVISFGLVKAIAYGFASLFTLVYQFAQTF
ncbi:putative mitochondrial protein [Andalucia godoyi]|uniref:Putative mitochondrial protein n=1 Tax=Andalucia godoyi TaxID=505711 RepID=A0A8K0F2X5_ANDGO|nr:putative mitochondrial protein [Andalucia godoyi]|eukprot:ANDGO_03434.mRNA.1 putative mitochondrial protein